MPEPGSPRIPLFLALAVVLATAAPTIGQMDWRPQSPATIPPVRGSSAMAYDTARDRVVAFGGLPITSYPPRYLNDTWEWDGQTWVQLKPAMSPAGRYYHTMVYDAARRRVVLFGGTNSQNVLNDTWEWDGKNWTQRNPATSPPSRWMHAMAYDHFRQRVVVFGGTSGPPGRLLGDTWEWDGKNWLQMQPATNPVPRQGHEMAHDSARRRTVLFGGGGAPGVLNDTWEWDGANWIQLQPAASPIRRYEHAMAYDAARERVVLFGGCILNPFPQFQNDTWEWDGINWIRSTPQTPPPISYTEPMAYDALRGSMIVLFHKTNNTAQHWTYAPRDLAASSPRVSVATGGTVKLSIDAGIAKAQKNYCVLGCMEATGPRGIPSLKVRLALNPDPYFWFTAQYPNPLIANSLGTLDTAGKATATIHVPPLPAGLIGWRFYHAYVAFRSSIDYASTPVPLTLVP